MSLYDYIFKIIVVYGENNNTMVVQIFITVYKIHVHLAVRRSIKEHHDFSY